MPCVIGAPLERLELSLSAPGADALSTELQGRFKNFIISRSLHKHTNDGRSAQTFQPSDYQTIRLSDYQTIYALTQGESVASSFLNELMIL